MAPQIDRIVILTQAREATTVEDAIRFIEDYDEQGHRMPIERYVIEVRYANGDFVCGRFGDKIDAIDFLRDLPAHFARNGLTAKRRP